MSNYAETHPTSKPDFFVENHGTIFLLRPNTPEAKAWLEEHTPADEDHQYLGNALCVEHRYILDIVDGIRNDGLTVGGQ